MMLFRVAQLIRHYANQGTMWLLNTAFAVDQLSAILMEHARRYHGRLGLRIWTKTKHGKTAIVRMRNMRW